MQYMQLGEVDRQALLAELEAMPRKLGDLFGDLADHEATRPGPADLFSPVEQVWHLADLEREGFGVRIDRLLHEQEPQLPDFDGDAIAQQRHYRNLSLADGLRVFEAARRDNLQKLRHMPDTAWPRSGMQEGLGKVALCDMPSLLWQHDAAHREEIRCWFEGAAGQAR